MASEKNAHAVCVITQFFFALETLNIKAKKNVKKDERLWTSLISLKRHTQPSHNTLFTHIIKMFSVTQTVTQSVRLNATVSKRDVTRRYEEVLLLKVFSVRVGSIIHFVLF